MTNPALYVTFAVAVVSALVTTYFVDPYVFGFTAIAAAGLAAVLAPMGLIVAAASRTLPPRARAVIRGAVVVAIAAAATALVLLSGFNWA